MDVTLKAHKSFRLMLSFAVLIGFVAFVATAGGFDNIARSGIGAPELMILGLILAVNSPQIAMTVWSMFGVEHITANRTGIRVERLLFGRRFSTRDFQRAQISNLHLDPIGTFRLSFGNWRRPFAMGRQYGIGAGPVVFECDGREVRLAEGLRRDEQAARELMISLSLALGMGLPTQSPGAQGADSGKPAREANVGDSEDSW